MEINYNSQPNIEKMESKEEEEEDHLSNLPESLLLHILSFLPMKSALKTRTLARRWRDLKADPLDLDFDFNYFNYVWYPSENLLRKYIDFVNRSLSLHQGSNIRKFRCALISSSMFGSPINSWIDFAITRKVQELHLYSIRGYYEDPYNLPDSFYEQNRSLTSLELERCNLEFHRLKSFSFLRSLSLYSIQLEDGPFHEFLGACSLLENLSISSCLGLDHLCIPTSCLWLHHLRIECCDLKSGLEIHAMNLLYLEVGGCNLKADSIFKISSSVKEVYLDLTLDSCLWKSCSQADDHDHISFRIFKHFADIEVLSLQGSCVQVASIWELRNFSSYFRKLKCLKLWRGFQRWTGCGRWQLHGIASLLRRSPQLETLMIYMCYEDYEYDEGIFTSDQKEYWESQQSSLPCLVHHLKTVNIFSDVLECNKPAEYVLKNWENEMKVVKFLLKNAMVLEKMTIRFSSHFMASDKAVDILMEIRQKLDQLPKASSHAQLLLT